MPGDDHKVHRRRLVVWLVVTLCVVAELVGLGLVRARGATGLQPPVISAVGLPSDPTAVRSATFMFTNERTVSFDCALDGGRTEPCGLGLLGSQSYPGPLALGSHRFEVTATAGGETSEPATFSWVIVAKPAAPEGDPATPTPDEGGATSPPGDNGAATEGGAPFDISGDVDGLAPGVTKTIPLTLHNPSAEPITVTSITVEIAVDSDPPGCRSEPNIVLEQATGISVENPVVVPAHGTVVLSAPPRAPRITFRNQPWNQDVCKGKSFALAYSGSAHP